MRLPKGIAATIWATILALIAGGIISTILTQLYFEKNVRAEQELRLKREVVVGQYQELQKMKRFAALGLRARRYIFKKEVIYVVDSIRHDTTFFSLNSDSTLYDNLIIPLPLDMLDTGPEYNIPKRFFVKSSTITVGDILMTSIPYDSLLQNEWMMLADEIKDARNRVDFYAYHQFQKIVEYVQKNPWPVDVSRYSYAKLKKSHWPVTV